MKAGATARFFVLVSACTAAGPAAASDLLRPSGEAGRVHAAESPQHFALDFRFGPYLPDVDSEFSGAQRPYASTFGDDDLFLFGVGLDWEYLRVPGGTLSVGVSLGFMQAVGPARTPSGLPSGEDTVLNILPVGFPVGFRFDWLAEEVGVPLVPYVKGGVAVYWWWVLNAGGVAGTDDDPAWGWTPGAFFAPGIMLRLDFFEPGAARSFDAGFGVNHSYLFFEGLLAWMDGFGSGEVMILSDMTWVAGLALEF